MDVLITGAAGFVGSSVTQAFVNSGADVGVLVREETDTRRIAHLLDRVERVSCDLFDETGLSKILERYRPTCCVHLAWYAEPGRYLHSPSNAEHLAASVRLISSLARFGTERIVAIGTCNEYLPSKEIMSESDPVQPQTVYSASKHAMALSLRRLSEETGVSTAWLRLFYLYGPNEDPRRLVPSVITELLSGRHALVTSGEQIRDYLHVDDVARGIFAVSQSTVEGSVNICSEEPVTVRQVVETIGNHLDASGRIAWGSLQRPPGDPDFVVGSSATLKRIGWSPHYSLSTGIEATIDWWGTQLR